MTLARVALWLLRPTAFVRTLALVLAVGLAVNLFFHGAQPYAVGLVSPPWDKLAHLSLFCGFAGLIWAALGGHRPLLAFCVCAAIGAADEWLQMSLPGRSPGLDDLLFDLLGAALAIGLLSLVRRLTDRWPRPAL